MTNAIIARRLASVGYVHRKGIKGQIVTEIGTDEQNEENEEAKMGEQKGKEAAADTGRFCMAASVTSDGSLTPEDVEYVQTFLLDVSNVTPEQITTILAPLQA